MLHDIDVMVVDDCEDILAFTGEQLKAMGIEAVRITTSGQAAIVSAGKRRPDLVLLDLHMPEMDGVEVIAQLADAAPGCTICLMTGADEAIAQTTGRIIESYGLRFGGMLRKPFRMAALRAILQAWERMSRPSSFQSIAPLSCDEAWHLLRRHALRLCYQPKLMLKDGTVAGVECLARLHHEERGLLPPAAFLPAIEASATAADFTALVMESSIRQLAEFQKQGHRLRLSINVAPDMLQQLDLILLLQELTSRNGIEPAAIMLEITETSIMCDVRSSLETLARLRLKGFGLSIDDFGVGSATLQQLQRIPCTEIKIDRMFVTNICEDRQAQAIMRSSIALGRELGLQVVAEGVETQLEFDAVAEMGCDMVQGYHYARPMQAAGLLEWLRHRAGAPAASPAAATSA